MSHTHQDWCLDIIAQHTLLLSVAMRDIEALAQMQSLSHCERDMNPAQLRRTSEERDNADQSRTTHVEHFMNNCDNNCLTRKLVMFIRFECYPPA